MVGEENISVRNRRSTYETAEEKEDLSKRHEADWSFPQSSNGEFSSSVTAEILSDLADEMISSDMILNLHVNKRSEVNMNLIVSSVHHVQWVYSESNFVDFNPVHVSLVV